jgi:hypothetical protein
MVHHIRRKPMSRKTIAGSSRCGQTNVVSRARLIKPTVQNCSEFVRVIHLDESDREQSLGCGVVDDLPSQFESLRVLLGSLSGVREAGLDPGALLGLHRLQPRDYLSDFHVRVREYTVGLINLKCFFEKNLA